MSGASRMDQLTELVRSQGRWPTIAVPLLEALQAEDWRRDGFPTPTAWLDRLAALGGRSTTYLSRCVSAARFLTELKASSPRIDLAPIWRRPLSAIEEFRRRTGNDPERITECLPQLSSGALTSYGMRHDRALAHLPGKAERMALEEIVLANLRSLLPCMGYSAEAIVVVEPRTPVGRPDIVLVEPSSGTTSIIEVKSELSRRKQGDIVQQLLAQASLGQKVWLILPSGSEVPGDAVITSLRETAIKHVGLVVVDPNSAEIKHIIPPEIQAPDNESRAVFRRLVLASVRLGA